MAFIWLLSFLHGHRIFHLMAKGLHAKLTDVLDILLHPEYTRGPSMVGPEKKFKVIFLDKSTFRKLICDTPVLHKTANSLIF